MALVLPLPDKSRKEWKIRIKIFESVQAIEKGPPILPSLYCAPYITTSIHLPPKRIRLPAVRVGVALLFRLSGQPGTVVQAREVVEAPGRGSGGSRTIKKRWTGQILGANTEVEYLLKLNSKVYHITWIKNYSTICRTRISDLFSFILFSDPLYLPPSLHPFSSEPSLQSTLKSHVLRTSRHSFTRKHLNLSEGQVWNGKGGGK